MDQNLINTDETLEFACVIKTICDEYDVLPEDLRFFPPANYLLSRSNKIQFKKRIAIKIPLPSNLAPKSMEDDPHLLLHRLRSPFPDFSPLSTKSTNDNSQINKLGKGLGEYRAQVSPNKKIQFWVWEGAQDFYICGSNSSYFVRKDDVLALTFFIKRLQRAGKSLVDIPILPSEMLTEIYKNSIGFLLTGRDMQDQYKKYRIPYKRGVLFSGPAGCGKTMTCRWLRKLCEQNNLAYRVVSMEDYREAAQRGGVRALFKLAGRKSGIIFFDDMDVMVKDRKKGGGAELSTFLSELDGIDPVEGVVYVFTTNYIEELDEAFVRPGRIDLWLPFQLPSSKLRKKFIDQRFNEEIKKYIDSDNVLKRTEGYSFAELEEIRKLICMDLIDEKQIDIDNTFKTFDKHRKDFEQRAIMGFGSLESKDKGEDEDEDEVYMDDQGVFVPLPSRFR